MTQKEKLETFIEKGFSYNPDTGKVYGVTGKEIVSKTRKGYIRISFTKNRKQYFLCAQTFAYYILYGEVPEQVDHINGIKDDNRKINLRAVNNQQNHFNRHDIKGFCLPKNTKKYRARIKINGKTIHLGMFDTEDQAREAYLNAKNMHHIIP